jgi:hypothetical protein
MKTIAVALCLVALSVSGVFSWCESLAHLSEGLWICNSSVEILVLDDEGNCGVDLTGVVAGCELLQVNNTHDPIHQTITYSNYVCNDVELCGAMPGLCDVGQTIVDTNVVFADQTCSSYTALGNGVIPTRCYNSDYSPASALALSAFALAISAALALW